MRTDKLLLLMDELGAKIPFRDEMDPNISSVPVGWHIEHIYMATLIITEQLLRSDPANYKWAFNKNRFMVFAMNRIPRGKGKAPAAVQPKERTSLARIEKYAEIAKEKLNAINDLNSNNHILHPYLGMLDQKASIRFMCIHARHHIEIINDILKAKRL